MENKIIEFDEFFVSTKVQSSGHFATEKELTDYARDYKKGTFRQGLGVGVQGFDRYLRFKQGKLLIVNGHDNVGKSTVIWFLALISAIKHDWNWLLFTHENEEGEVFVQLIEFYCGKQMQYLNEKEIEIASKFILNHFKIFRVDKMYTATDVIKIAETEAKTSRINGILIDPYNSLEVDYSKMIKGENQHNYDYKVAANLRLFAKTNNVYTVLNCHAATEALRKTHKSGDTILGFDVSNYPIAPNKSDTEGGGKFSNRADDFVTIHRYTQHNDLYTWALIHVRKVKNVKTGGMPTPLDQPIVMKYSRNRFEVDGIDILENCKVDKMVDSDLLRKIDSEKIF